MNAATEGLEAVELDEPDSGLALLEHFGITTTDFADTEPAPELTLVPIERDELADWVKRSRQSLLRHILGDHK